MVLILDHGTLVDFLDEEADAAAAARSPSRHYAVSASGGRCGTMWIVEGIARRVQRNQEGSDVVLRCVVTANDGSVRAVEIRGHEIRGVLDDGDRVSFDASSASADGLQRPTLIHNLTTASAVTAWRAPRWKRTGGSLAMMVASAAISAVVTTVIGAALVIDGRTAARPGDDTTGDSATVALLVIAAAFTATMIFIWLRRRRWPTSARPLAVGITVGVLLGLLILVSSG